MRTPLLFQFVGAVAAAAGAWGCSGADAGDTGSAARQSDATGQASVPRNLASSQTNGCNWLSLAEVEAIIGKIEGSPEREGTGCWYRLPIDSATREWKQMRENERRLRELGGELEGFKQIELLRPGLYVAVDVTGSLTEEIAGAAANEHLAKMLPDQTPQADNPESVVATKQSAWDYVGSPMGRAGFVGRMGHVKVTIAMQKLIMADDTVESLAARVLNRVPDRPFAHEAANMSASPRGGADPCSVLTPAEVEAVLGKLVNAPYRTRDGSALADPAGRSCGYFTRGHHVLVVTPEWSDGKTTLRISRGVGDLIGSIVNLPGVVADTLEEGPWDEVAADGATGDLLFLKGDRLIQISYAMSSADAAGAVRLARIALPRLQN